MALRLVCWDQGTPEPHLPFLATHPNLTIHGALGRGILFGTHLQGTAYSKISETQFMSVCMRCLPTGLVSYN